MVKGSATRTRPYATLRFKLLAGICGVVVLLVVGILLFVNRVQARAMNQEVLAKIEAVAKGTAAELTAPMRSGDMLSVFDRIRRTSMVGGDIQYAAAVDSSGRILLESDTGFSLPVVETLEFESAVALGNIVSVTTLGPDGQSYTTQIAPIQDFDRTYGALLVGFDPTRILAATIRAEQQIILLGGIGLAVGILLAFFLARGITKPIERLKAAAVRVGHGEFGRTVEVETRDEIGTLAITFNTMSLELKKRETEVRRAERLSAIGTTASAIAHEMKTPLTSIQAFTDLVQTKYADPKFRRRYADQVGPQIMRLQRLVDDLLDYSREVRLNLTDLDLNLHMHQAVNVFKEQLSQHRVQVFERYDADGMIKADHDKLEHLFFNLIKNAVEAMGEGGAISMITRQEGDEVVALVADSGTGIPSDTIPNIFEPFYTTKSKGTGLGLAIVKKVLKAHGGTIRLYTPLRELSDEHARVTREVLGDHWPGTDQGTCFCIRLPAVTDSKKG